MLLPRPLAPSISSLRCIVKEKRSRVECDIHSRYFDLRLFTMSRRNVLLGAACRTHEAPRCLSRCLIALLRARCRPSRVI